MIQYQLAATIEKRIVRLIFGEGVVKIHRIEQQLEVEPLHYSGFIHCENSESVRWWYWSRITPTCIIQPQRVNPG
ncbi:unnamed protein product [Allacma fusca]|uniref:Uncharacterized protein n=1 Tax=Allacma fusca TaxID=39272 RepID=A0A8J2P2R2_9HEXA|nr:unnamed protein product [Allacma fusca]